MVSYSFMGIFPLNYFWLFFFLQIMQELLGNIKPKSIIIDKEIHGCLIYLPWTTKAHVYHFMVNWRKLGLFTTTLKKKKK